MPLLEEKELFDAAVDVGPGVIPGVTRVMLVRVRPGVGKVPNAVFLSMYFRYSGNRDIYTSPLSGLTLAKAYRICVSFSAGRSWGLWLRP